MSFDIIFIFLWYNDNNNKGDYMKKVLIFLIIIILTGCKSKKEETKKEEIKEINLNEMSLDEIKTYGKENNITITINYDYSDLLKDEIINIEEKDKEIIITVSNGKTLNDLYKELSVNENGNVPVMMYHGIVDKKDSETPYTGGNADRDGYARTAESFRRDLEFYYNSGYRMIRLSDYVNGIIDCEIGKSPIVLTFDDGLSNNIKVTGLDENGNIIIDPNSAVGILEEFKKKYPDYNVTATFFVNGGLFGQPLYNDKILEFLVNNGYDIGNHTYNHVDFTKVNSERASAEVGSVYNLLDKYIPNKYVNIVALPFGSPYNKSHSNFNYILNSSYNGVNYNTVSTLRVGWESNLSPFNINFDKTFLKRIRAYDNLGVDFDIDMNFKILENKRFISDGDKNKVVVPNELKDLINTNLELVTY